MTPTDEVVLGPAIERSVAVYYLYHFSADRIGMRADAAGTRASAPVHEARQMVVAPEADTVPTRKARMRFACWTKPSVRH